MVTRAWWLGMGSDEESRAHLQSRLVVLSQLMFWSYLALVFLMFGLYQRFEEIQPQHQNKIYGLSVLGMLFLVAIWRGFLVRRELGLRALFAVDAFYAASSGAIFAASTLIAHDRHMAITANILWTCLFIFLRTIVLPSTGRRTAIVSSIAMIPMLAASIVLPFLTRTEFPLEALVASTALVAVLIVAVATFGSRLIFGLRIQADAAKRLGQYTLGLKIGEGGNGSVYRAHHALLRRPAAIKVIRPDKVDAETLDRFEREVQHMAQLTHPNTVAVFDYGRDPEGLFYYAMEYLDGIDLEKLVAGFGPQPDDRVVAILVQVCGALTEAHNRGLVHRDIKPANIILCERGDVPDIAKVVDFGLVKELTNDRADPNHTNRIFGTPAFIAPECITGDADALGPSVDIYGVGAVGYFLVTGRCLFPGNNAVDVCLKHVTEQPTPPSELVATVSPELEAILLRCLAKDPKQRPQSAVELARLLRAVKPAGTWTEADAERWWRELKNGLRASVHTKETITITVDLGQRAANDEEPRERRVSRPA